jgi:hypothetical protein
MPFPHLLRLANRLRATLRDEEADATFIRLTRSKHVADLQLIAVVTLYCAAIFPIVSLLLAGLHVLFSDHWKIYWEHPYRWWVPFVFFGELGAVVLSIAGGFYAIVGTILAWCYQSGSARLGIVDLFACEMTTLCRVCTIVELTQKCIDAFNKVDADPNNKKEVARVREGFSHFDSAEVYTPVFDANAKDLQVLNVGVVTNITSFYTYWKAMRDAFRQLASTVTGKPSEIDFERWKGAMCNVIYMQFLAFESARKAIDDLIEFEPSHAENKITILLSELPAFHFLLDQFTNEDVRHKRLELRRHEYPDIIEAVRTKTEANAKKYPKGEERSKLSKHERDLAAGWDKAAEMVGPLNARYQQAFPEK